MSPEEKVKLTNIGTTVFGLLRHGTTVWNEEKRIQGSKDSKLSPRGKEATIHWAHHLLYHKWQRILASDLGRAKETVRLLNTVLKLPVYYESRLRELDWGDWEGKKLAEITTQHNLELERQILRGWEFRPPGGESRREALERAKAAILEASSKWPGEKILVLCHQGIIKCIIYDIMQKSFLPTDSVKLDKNGLHIISVQSGKLLCDHLNSAANIPT